ncbi:MAG: Fatty acid desaturase [Gammaproteobacteria bacterium]|nr:Fatty acid desaturase [Gammaproteobacteria bacterium]
MSAVFQPLRCAWPNLLVILYTFSGWALGIYLLTRPPPALNAAGVLLITHALIYSGYLIHECAHHAVFEGISANDRLGSLLSWLNGACLANYQRLKKKHLRHHADRLDVVTFDYRAALTAAPAWVRRGVLFLEWAYVPAVELMMRGMVIGSPFQYGTTRERARVIVLLLIRLIFFTALALISIKAVLLYALSYLLFLNVLRFLDAFQHTYEVFPSRSLAPAPPDPRRTRRYEYENTYSNLLSEHWWWLNLLVLNFPYHNAHHERAGESWYRLPALHRALFSNKDPQVIPCRELARSYHRHRVARILASDYGYVATEGARASSFLGAVGVSFLTAV